MQQIPDEDLQIERRLPFDTGHGGVLQRASLLRDCAIFFSHRPDLINPNERLLLQHSQGGGWTVS